MSRTYSLYREGFFSSRLTGTDHCGSSPTETVFRYSVEIFSTALDSQGFIVDALCFQACADDCGDGLALSCEEHAFRIARQVYARVDPDLRPFITRILVTSSPSYTNAHAKCDWSTPNQDFYSAEIGHEQKALDDPSLPDYLARNPYKKRSAPLVHRTEPAAAPL